MIAPAPMRDVIVVGGGCYGTFYAGQLAKARARGKTDYRRVLVVDRDPDCPARRELGEEPGREFVTAEWGAFFDTHLAGSAAAPSDAAADVIVPSPHMPHLLFEWLMRRARARWPDRAVSASVVPGTLETPYDRAVADGTRYVSFADWICPTHCIEPATCPAIGAPRTWEMGDAVTALADRLRATGRPVRGAALFVCRHHAFGVGVIPVAAVLAGDRLVAEAGDDPGGGEVLVGTISSCHGALNIITVAGEAP
jgi:hypothetical protein